MGVDVSEYFGFGVEAEGNTFRESCDCKNEEIKYIISSDDLDKVGAEIITDGYGNEFSILLVNCFDGEKDKLIENINQVEEKWNYLAKKYNIVEKPSFTYGYYYW